MSPKFAPIGMKTLSRPTSAVTSRKVPSAQIPVELQRGRVVGQPEISASCLIDRGVIAGDKQVGPAVVVVIEEPSGETCRPGAPARRRLAWQSTSVKVPSWLLWYRKLCAVQIGDVEIHVAVVVVIGGRHAFAEHAVRSMPAAVRRCLESAVALVEEKLRGAVLIADEQIEKAVVVDIGPNRGLRAASACARPLASVTSVKVPSQLLRSSDLRCGNSQAAAQNQNVQCSHRCCSRPGSCSARPN